MALTTPPFPMSKDGEDSAVDIQKEATRHGDEQYDEGGESAALLPSSPRLVSHPSLQEDKSEPWRPLRLLTGRSSFLIAIIGSLLLAAAVAGTSWWQETPRPRNRTDSSFEILSNGTHPFGRTVILVSLDGLRYVIWLVGDLYVP